MVRDLRKYLVIIAIGVLMFIPTSVFADGENTNPMVLTNGLEYYIGSNTGISYVINAENNIEKVSVDSSDLDTSKYVLTESSLSFSSEYLDTLSVGTHSVVVTYNDGVEVTTSNTSFEVLETKVNDELVDDSNVVENQEEITTIEEVIEVLPDYYFVSVKEDNSSSDVVVNEIYDNVIETLTDNNIDIETFDYDVEVNVDSSEDIFNVDVTFDNKTEENDSYVKSGNIVYSNADDYVEADHDLVNEFVNSHSFVYKDSYELTDDFSDESYNSEDVNNYLDNMFNDTSIDYNFYEIDSNDNLIGKVLMFVNSKYYASSNVYYKNVPYVYVPWFIEDVNSYVANAAYNILSNKYNLEGHSLTYHDGHLYDETSNTDFGELDYIITDSYEFNYVSGDLIYEKSSNNDLVIVFNEELGDATSLVIGDSNVDESNYSIDGKSLIVNYLYLNTLKNNNYKLHLETNRGYGDVDITIIPKQYTYIDGANSVFDKADNKTLTVRINADINKFVNIYLNNNVLSSNVYTLREGSTIIDISFDYLECLANGVYKLKTIFTDGEAVTNLSISGKKVDYKVTSVSNQTYEKKSNNNVSFNLNNVSNITNLDINGVSISNSYYYVSNNSVIVKGSYLDNLNNGKYNVSIKFNDGSVSSYLNVKEKQKQSSSSTTTSSGSSYVPVRRYYTPTYYNYTYSDEEDVVVTETVVEEKKDDNTILEVVDDVKDKKTDTTEKKTTKKDTNKEKTTETKKKTTKKSTTKKSTTKNTENKTEKKSIFSIFKKKDNNKKTDSDKKLSEKKTTEKSDNTKEKKSIFSIFKKSDSKKTDTDKKVTEEKKDSSKKSIFSIFKKKDEKKETNTTTTSEKKNTKSDSSKKKLDSKKTDNSKSNENKALLINVDKIVNSRIFIASLIILICSLTCYILYMVTKKDEED